MRRAIITLSRKGLGLGRRLHRLLDESDLYVPAAFGGDGNEEFAFDPPVSGLVGEVFGRYETLIFIMASGIAVRAVAPHLRGKREDPGVLVMDERGRHVISLLGGHSRRGNELARHVAALIGAEPVLTTASDVEGYPAVDLLGQEFGWELERRENLTHVSAAVVNGEAVGLFQDAGERDFGGESFPPNVVEYRSLEELARGQPHAAVLITDRVLSGQFRSLEARSILYRPKSLVVGVGFNRGTEAGEIEGAIAEVFERAGLSLRSVRCLATLDRKAQEKQLIEICLKRGWEIRSYTAAELREVAFPSRPSEAVLRAVGAPAVAEPAAILASGNPDLIVPKTRLGNVAVAVARIPFAPRGKLYVIGTGPGNPDLLTLHARRALAECDAVLGYKTYIRLLGNLVRGRRVIASGMRHELERARQAMELASSGRKVALVSGGDPGLYGMSAPLFEALCESRDRDFEIEVVPGVPAFTAAAALLGAPLGQDTALVSLSDLLTPWEVIESRLRHAAEGDFVIALYNPRSKGRPDQFARAVGVIGEYRPDTTPVGLVKNAFREGQSVVLTTLGGLLRHHVDMSSIVLVGNSRTRLRGGWMVTPRGYRDKYG